MYKKIKLGVLIPTRDRPIFLRQALGLIDRQTVKPDVIEIVNDKPIHNGKDVSWRYRIGCDRLFEKGVDVIIFWEDDDWYSKNYIETIINGWIENGKPDILGINSTVYYHIQSQRWTILEHNNRASAMSTIVTKEILNIQLCKDTDLWFDIHIWKKLNGIALNFKERINVGIKHGIGLTGGVGHINDHKIYKNTDKNYSFLESLIGADIDFYKGLRL